MLRPDAPSFRTPPVTFRAAPPGARTAVAYDVRLAGFDGRRRVDDVFTLQTIGGSGLVMYLEPGNAVVVTARGLWGELWPHRWDANP